MKKRIYTAAGLFLAAALVLGGCGKEKVPESEFATADEAKEALTSAETIDEDCGRRKSGGLSSEEYGLYQRGGVVFD